MGIQGRQTQRAALEIVVVVKLLFLFLVVFRVMLLLLMMTRIVVMAVDAAALSWSAVETSVPLATCGRWPCFGGRALDDELGKLSREQSQDLVRAPLPGVGGSWPCRRVSARLGVLLGAAAHESFQGI
ncbi:hypothetical protein VTK73DRAFT_4644 [Phialemonium thermophilum]|uniref:Uncharacterized protein n=1 Tax=Phialemonium thermophilum TaxID=223376 RepID=A0ABR3V733_9PEZI